MKKIGFHIFLILLTPGLFGQTNDFKHDWDMKYLEHGVQFTSKKQAPIPFSTTGEPQAMMIIDASVLDSSQKDLIQIVNDEIVGIKNDLSIIEYMENDHKPVNNIVTYFDKVNDTKIAVIKYRTNGDKIGKRSMPRSVRQILFFHTDKLYISSLIVLFGDDQENMRSDQMTFIRDVLNKK